MESNSKCDSLSPQALEQILGTARTHNAFSDNPVPEALLREIYELTKWGPTSANGSPGRFVFLTTPQAQARLRPHLFKANQRKRLGAAVQVLIAYDLRFADYFPRLFPHNSAVSTWFADPQLAQETALRNGSLQGAYLMIAARALGLNCGPMSGFDARAVDAEFFAATHWRTNFICNIGYGADEHLFERLPRLAFEEACRIL
jgi:3-hydroxypropanoate dehydrogenase